MSHHYYSSDYITARQRFVSAARQVQAGLRSYRVPEVSKSHDDVTLSIDVAEIGSGRNLTIVSSGTHGVEGIFGSAVQLALLDELSVNRLSGRVLFIHAVNPWGFHHIRRVDEQNIDLNRNFRRDRYAGAPNGYRKLNSFLNPATVPSRMDAFGIRAAIKIIRYGMTSLKESVATGQYEFPQGLFYGGRSMSASTQIIADNIHDWVGAADSVLHIDLHSGLGKYGQLKLLCNHAEKAASIDWFKKTFGAEPVESLNNNSATAYPVSGQFGAWLQQEFSHIDYRFIGAEYGTYSALKVVQALRRENCHHFFGNNDNTDYAAAKNELAECFCPADPVWRQQVLSSALSVVRSGAYALNQQ